MVEELAAVRHQLENAQRKVLDVPRLQAESNMSKRMQMDLETELVHARETAEEVRQIANAAQAELESLRAQAIRRDAAAAATESRVALLKKQLADCEDEKDQLSTQHQQVWKQQLEEEHVRRREADARLAEKERELLSQQERMYTLQQELLRAQGVVAEKEGRITHLQIEEDVFKYRAEAAEQRLLESSAHERPSVVSSTHPIPSPRTRMATVYPPPNQVLGPYPFSDAGKTQHTTRLIPVSASGTRTFLGVSSVAPLAAPLATAPRGSSGSPDRGRPVALPIATRAGSRPRVGESGASRSAGSARTVPKTASTGQLGSSLRRSVVAAPAGSRSSAAVTTGAPAAGDGAAESSGKPASPRGPTKGGAAFKDLVHKVEAAALREYRAAHAGSESTAP
mmetsp:Transcript_7895/g.19396  ORF Transcript_7895/g.19396 Transcript_7895/m.19396 type:complete len:396 (+) Transcript_7895:1536-2723(+)